MIVREVKDKKIWESFLLGCCQKTFLDSWQWGEFNRVMGSKIWRLGIFESKNLLGVALIIKVKAKRGTFLFIPHGPNITNSKFQILKTLLEELKKIAEKEKCIFIRIAPIWEENEEDEKMFEDLGFRNAPIHMHPELTWELDITPPEQELLLQMRKTTRYLIRQGLKNRDIEILQSKEVKDVENFNQLYQETAGRHSFVPFFWGYLKNEFLTFGNENNIALFLGKYKNEVISSAMIIFWQGIAFYHQGASSSKYPKIPVSYLIQWEAILEAKKRGCHTYNFWGIAPFSTVTENGNPKLQISRGHPWTGLTLFKIGFGGYPKEYCKTQDLPLSKKYWLTFLFEKLRKRKRNL